jgi:hypothetical protein
VARRDLRDSSFRSVDVDPRLRGGDEVLTFISMGGLQAHDHSG